MSAELIKKTGIKKSVKTLHEYKPDPEVLTPCPLDPALYSLDKIVQSLLLSQLDTQLWTLRLRSA
jgi:hypothetical protein